MKLFKQFICFYFIQTCIHAEQTHTVINRQILKL